MEQHKRSRNLKQLKLSGFKINLFYDDIVSVLCSFLSIFEVIEFTKSNVCRVNMNIFKRRTRPLDSFTADLVKFNAWCPKEYKFVNTSNKSLFKSIASDIWMINPRKLINMDDVMVKVFRKYKNFSKFLQIKTNEVQKHSHSIKKIIMSVFDIQNDDNFDKLRISGMLPKYIVKYINNPEFAIDRPDVRSVYNDVVQIRDKMISSLYKKESVKRLVRQMEQIDWLMDTLRHEIAEADYEFANTGLQLVNSIVMKRISYDISGPPR